MHIRKSRFEVHKAQKIAAALLAAFLIQSLWLVAHVPLDPLDMFEARAALAGRSLWSSRQLLGTDSPLIPGDSILTLRCAGALSALAAHWETKAYKFSIYAAPNRWLVRLPFVVFGVWLGAALWWVARRIFGDEGGYVALGLYCFNPFILLESASANSEIVAAWGLFGLIFTAIGVAHTLYAPSRKWRPRILLLGIAIGLTAAGNVAAAVIGLCFSAAFMLYLAPGRRVACLAILAVSSAIGTAIFLTCFGFNQRDLAAAALLPNSEYLRFTATRINSMLTAPGGLLEIVAFLAAVLVFVFWKRARYFGNAAPLIVALFLPWWPGRFFPGTSDSASVIWALPFAFAFVGGIYADLLDRKFLAGHFRRLVTTTALVLVGASAALSLALLAHTSRF